MFDNGFFGGLFDFDGDGKLDVVEAVADFAAFMTFVEDDSSDDSDDEED